jgi:hypothetical protein
MTTGIHYDIQLIDSAARRSFSAICGVRLSLIVRTSRAQRCRLKSAQERTLINLAANRVRRRPIDIGDDGRGETVVLPCEATKKEMVPAQ